MTLLCRVNEMQKRAAFFLAELAACILVLIVPGTAARAQGPLTDLKTQVGFDQHPNAQIPLDLVFHDDKGQDVRLGDYFGNKPAILTLNYFNCPNLCTLELDQLAEALAQVPFDLGNQYDVITVSFDPRDTTALALAEKWEAIRHYARPGLGDGWHVLTGDASAIRQLTQAVGFRYAHDAQTDEFAHPLGVIFLTPQGKIYRYLYGEQFNPTDLRLSLVAASQNKIGTVIDQVLLVCYHYDPAQGKYSTLVIQMSQVAGIATVLVLGVTLARWWRQDLKRDAEYLKNESKKD